METIDRLALAGSDRTEQLAGALLLLFEIHGQTSFIAPVVRSQAERGSSD
jgi:hypothetical protein